MRETYANRTQLYVSKYYLARSNFIIKKLATFEPYLNLNPNVSLSTNPNSNPGSKIQRSTSYCNQQKFLCIFVIIFQSPCNNSSTTQSGVKCISIQTGFTYIVNWEEFPQICTMWPTLPMHPPDFERPKNSQYEVVNIKKEKYIFCTLPLNREFVACGASRAKAWTFACKYTTSCFIEYSIGASTNYK